MTRNLFIIGAQRSGSTYLYRMLAAHPEIAMAEPVRPEPKYFLAEDVVARGRDAYEERYFAHRTPGTRVLGEKSTTYIERPEVAERIQALYPDALIVAILRDPVERAWSNYRFSVENGLETLEFGEALEAEDQRCAEGGHATSTSPFAYRARGEYIRYLQPWVERFGDDSVRVLVFEEFVGAAEPLQDLYRWLGVDGDFVPEGVGGVVNRSSDTSEVGTSEREWLQRRLEPANERLEAFLGRPLDAWRRARAVR